MRVLVDLQPLIQSSRFGVTGIARWTLGALRALVAQAPDWQIEGFAVLDSDDRAPNARPQRLEFGRRLTPLWGGPVWLLSGGNGVTVDWGHDAPDAVLGTAFLTPAGGRVAEVPVIHDLAFIKHPQTQPQETLDLLKADLPGVMERAPLVVTVSSAMAVEITEQYGIDPALIEVVSPGSDGNRQLAVEASNLEMPADVPQDFFLVVGTLEPRKNIRAILQAHQTIKKRRPDFPPLVLAGAMGWREEQFSDLLEKQITAGHAVWLGFVSQSLLDTLYRRAIALVFPSLYEGFGLPILEAMSAGCPVITSNCTGTLEAAGDAALMVDPNDAGAIERAIELIFDDSFLRGELKKKGLLHVSRFTWERTGDKLREAISRAVDLKG